MPFSLRVERVGDLVGAGHHSHPVDFQAMENGRDIESFFNTQAVNGIAEGIVVRCDDGRIFKIKPDISIDAAVIGYTASANGIHDLLLGLMEEDGSLQLIGRVDIGFSTAERREVVERLAPLSCESTLYLTSRNGLPYIWIKPELVVEVTCHELLTHRTGGERVLRPRVDYSPDAGWSPLGKDSSISMRDAVFVRVRDDNPYVGATEQAIRDVFERARKNAPSLILFDELDSIAPSRSMADAHHQQTLVAQLLTLLDGVEGRSGISVLATTNRPKSIDPALRPPGRFDTVVWMKLPDEHGRAAILQRYLKPLRLDSSIDAEALTIELAAMTDGASGADLEFLCQTAARVCVKDAIRSGLSPENMTICRGHIETALVSLGYICATPDEIILVIPAPTGRSG